MDNNLELFNEFCVTALLSLILGYANPNIDGPTRFNMGEFCIVIVVLTLVVNFGTIVMSLWYDVLLRAERCFNIHVGKPL